MPSSSAHALLTDMSSVKKSRRQFGGGSGIQTAELEMKELTLQGLSTLEIDVDDVFIDELTDSLITCKIWDRVISNGSKMYNYVSLARLSLRNNFKTSCLVVVWRSMLLHFSSLQCKSVKPFPCFMQMLLF